MNGDADAGRKDDAGKLRYDLVPPKPWREFVSVLTFGAKKYGAENWRKVPDAKARYTAALLRHIEAWRDGENRDWESGCHHLAHACCCLFFLLELELELDPPEANSNNIRWTDTFCSKCGCAQFIDNDEGGVTCKNGHKPKE